jgi:hypothetical protein
MMGYGRKNGSSLMGTPMPKLDPISIPEVFPSYPTHYILDTTY